jgi:hypothetical protein
MMLSSATEFALSLVTSSRRTSSSTTSHCCSRVLPMPLITVIGVRSSCETVERKSVFSLSSSERRSTVRRWSSNR